MTPPNSLHVLNLVIFTAHMVELLLANQSEIKMIKLYTDNDDAGKQAAMIITEALNGSGIVVGTMEQSYNGAKDLNDWWLNTSIKK